MLKNNCEFYSKGKDSNKTNCVCKDCFNKYCINRWTQRKIDAVLYKGGKCFDCHLSYDNNYYIFDFHHRDPLEKDCDWTKLRLKSWDKIKTEIDKCD